MVLGWLLVLQTSLGLCQKLININHINTINMCAILVYLHVFIRIHAHICIYNMNVCMFVCFLIYIYIYII